MTTKRATTKRATRKRATRKRAKSAPPSGEGRQPAAIPAAAFKATCLELMDRVRETGEAYVVTKHGRPVVKVVPYTEPARRTFFGSMNGTVLRYERPFDSVDGDYDVNEP